MNTDPFALLNAEKAARADVPGSFQTGEALAAIADSAGLPTAAITAGADFHGEPTCRLSFPSSAAPLTLEVSGGFAAGSTELQQGLQRYLQELALRLRNPQPELYVTVEGLPLRFFGFAWPFHRSTSGADTFLVHGTVSLADSPDSVLHAKVAASMTVTFAEIVPAPEQPYAEDFIYNAIRRTFDYGQLELLKSGNRQPVPVTTRYYSRWQKKFLFTDTTEQGQRDFLARKAFWLSGVHGANAPVWLADPRDAQYLNTSEAELRRQAEQLAAAGMLTLEAGSSFGAPTPALMAQVGTFRGELAQALQGIKPSFNEDMRAGHTNM